MVPRTYSICFNLDFSISPTEMIHQIERQTNPSVVFALDRYIDGAIVCTLLSEAAQRRLIENGLVLHQGRKIDVQPVVTNTRGFLIPKIRRSVTNETVIRSLKVYGKVLSVKRVNHPNDNTREYDGREVMITLHHNLPKYVCISGEQIVIEG